MKVAISGSSGLIGTALSAKLEESGHQVVSLVRRPPASAAEIGWDPSQGLSEPESAEGLDAIVHLAGANIGESRWSDSRKRLLRESRVDATSPPADVPRNTRSNRWQRQVTAARGELVDHPIPRNRAKRLPGLKFEGRKPISGS